MTKYILHGGYTRKKSSDNDTFFSEMTADFPTGKVNILICYFARTSEDASKCFPQDKEFFRKNSKNKNLHFEIADEKKLAQQLEHSHVFYMVGGETKWLTDKLKLTPNLSKLFSNKTIAGVSAGAYALSKYYYSNDHQELRACLGILNLKVYCHYKKGDEKFIKLLADYQEKLPIIILPEFKWQVICQ